MENHGCNVSDNPLGPTGSFETHFIMYRHHTRWLEPENKKKKIWKGDQPKTWWTILARESEEV